MIQVDVPLEFFYFIWFGVWVFLVSTISIILAWLYTNHTRSPEGKTWDHAKRKGKPIIITEGDDNLVHVKVAHETSEEGYSKTKKGWGAFWSRSQSTPQLDAGFDEDEVKELAKMSGMSEDDIDKMSKMNDAELGDYIKATKEAKYLLVANYLLERKTSKKEVEKYAPFLSGLNDKKGIAAGSKIPVGFGYEGKAIISTIRALAGIDLLENAAATGTLPNGGKSEPIFVNLRLIKVLFGKSWNSAQRRAADIKHYMAGYQAALKLSSNKWWIWLLPPIFLVVGLIMGYFMKG